MAGLTKEQRAERAAAKEPQDAGLIAMQKDGEVIEVHPTCISAHKQAGWKELEK